MAARTPRSGWEIARSGLLGQALLLAAPAAQADAISVVNALRKAGCGGPPVVAEAVAASETLDEVARVLSRVGRLEDAFEDSPYPASSATSFHLRGSRADAAVREILTERYCRSVVDTRYEEIGVFGRGDETWIVLAARQAPPPVLDAAAVAAEVLELVNRARSEARDCGRERFDAAPPLRLSTALNEAAALHAQDMAGRGAAEHRGSDGSLAGDRIRRAGYAWRVSAENVAAGQRDAAAVIAAWLESPGHCANLMGPHFTDMGIAFALAPEHDPAIYWAQVFAAPL